MELREHFERLDPSVWTYSYLPAWRSRDAAAASYSVGPHGLALSIPEGQQLWFPEDHPTPLRVSGIHSANRCGPAGSLEAQQPFRDVQVVRESADPDWFRAALRDDRGHLHGPLNAPVDVLGLDGRARGAS